MIKTLQEHWKRRHSLVCKKNINASANFEEYLGFVMILTKTKYNNKNTHTDTHTDTHTHRHTHTHTHTLNTHMQTHNEIKVLPPIHSFVFLVARRNFVLKEMRTRFFYLALTYENFGSNLNHFSWRLLWRFSWRLLRIC